MKAIGIDIGTTSVCGVVIDVETGDILRSVTKNSDSFIKSCAPWEKIQSVEKIMETATGILDSFIEDGISAIGVTGQMHGIVYTDASGKAVSPLYIWQDGRGNLPYKDSTYAKHLKSFTGYGNVTDFYNRENGIRPESAVSYCTIHDYFVMRLCSLSKPVIHSSDAASFGLYNLETNAFDYDFSPEIATGYHIAGRYKGIPVSVAIGDNQASVFSTLADENHILVNMGTGSQVSVVSDTPVYGENIETRPYFEGKYLIVGSALCGGRAYSLLRDFYSAVLCYAGESDDEAVYGIMNKMLENAEGTPLTVDTRFAGTRSNPDLRGSINGIGDGNFTPENLTLGVLHGMAEELYGMYRLMSCTKSGIVGSGNGIRKNPALVKVFEEMFASKLQIPAHLEEAAYGAALFALVAEGTFKSANQAQKIIKYIGG